MKDLFWNEQQQRWRAFWRILMLLLLWNALIFLSYGLWLLFNGQTPVFVELLIDSPNSVRLLTLLRLFI